MIDLVLTVVLCGLFSVGLVVAVALLVQALFVGDHEEMPRPPTIFGDDDDAE